MLIIPFTSSEADLSNAGGKGLNLARLTRAGFPVPTGFILSTDAYRSFVVSNELQGVIDHSVGGLAGEYSLQLESASSHIREAYNSKAHLLISERHSLWE
jgi:pyruvate,water dikinase